MGGLGQPVCAPLIDHGRDICPADASGAVLRGAGYPGITWEGVNVQDFQADVSDAFALRAAMDNLSAASSLAGVLHTAGTHGTV